MRLEQENNSLITLCCRVGSAGIKMSDIAEGAGGVKAALRIISNRDPLLKVANFENIERKDQY